MHKHLIPIVSLVLMGILSSCSSLPKMPTLAWKHQQTPDKKVQLGRRDNSISIQTEGVVVRVDVPKEWKIVSCVDETLNWHYAASSADAALGFGMKVVRFPENPSLESRYTNYLDGIRRVYDPDVQMVAAQPFMVQGKKIPSYIYSSAGWGQRLVVMVPNGSVTTVFEFYARSPSVFTAGHDFIQKIFNTYSLRKS